MAAQLSGIGRTALVTTCDVNAHGRELRQQHVELPKSHERLAADNRHVQRLLPPNDVEHAVDEFLSLVVGQFAKHDVTAQMRVAVRVAPGASQRALARDLDREVGTIPRKNQAPGFDDRCALHGYGISRFFDVRC